MALQRATAVNDAHDTLKDPIRRATYLCGLHGVEVDAERNTSMPADFLMQQMEWRESLEDAAAAKNLEALSQLDQEVVSAIAESELLIEHLLDKSPADAVRAADEIRRLMFLSKFSGQVRDEQRKLMDGAASDL
jgi:molecular chaperone HscB